MTNGTSRLRGFLLGYALLIGLGTILLGTSWASASEALTFREALFMAVSAVCLVGLTVVNTATDLSAGGQAVMLLLIQAGAVFYLFFAVLTFRQMRGGAAYTGNASSSPRDVLLRVLKITTLVEGGAFLLIYYTGGNSDGGIGHKAFTAVFHAVSAFGNAGFSVLPDNLHSVPRAFVLHLAILTTFGLGGLGIDVLYDLFSPRRLRQRLANPSVDWRWGTRVSVNTSMVLVGLGGLLFYALEQHNVLTELNLTEKLIGSLFQSGTARTAGFYTVDIAQLTTPTLVMLIGLMFIGGGSGSTAGGIHTATLHRAFAFRNLGQAHWRTMAWWIIGYALMVNALGLFALHFLEPQSDLVSLLFVQVSAFSSVGLSPIAITTLSSAGQTVLLLSMLLGRVGTLALMMHLSTNVSEPLLSFRQ